MMSMYCLYDIEMTMTEKRGVMKWWLTTQWDTMKYDYIIEMSVLMTCKYVYD